MGLVISKNMYSMHFDEYAQHQGWCTHCTRLKMASLKLFARAELSTDFSSFYFSQKLKSTLFSEGASTLNMVNFRLKCTESYLQRSLFTNIDRLSVLPVKPCMDDYLMVHQSLTATV